MKKTLLILSVLLTFVMSSASASLIPYWTLSDTTTANSELVLSSQAGWDNANFGLFSVDDIDNPTTIKYAQIFKSNDSNGFEATAKFVHSVSSYDVVVKVKDNTTPIPTLLREANYLDFGNVFGFYFYRDQYQDSTHNASDMNSVLDSWDRVVYSDSTLNSNAGLNSMDMDFSFLDDNIVYVSLMYNNNRQLMAKVDDVAPVPEPGTLLLLGFGLIGLAFLKRRKQV